LKLFDARRKRQCGPLRAGRQHRLGSIRHRDDACLEQDLLALQAARVARAVEPLVVLTDDLRDRPREFDATQAFVAALGVRLDELEFRR
jgi:hypothetical protein